MKRTISYKVGKKGETKKTVQVELVMGDKTWENHRDAWADDSLGIKVGNKLRDMKPLPESVTFEVTTDYDKDGDLITSLSAVKTKAEVLAEIARLQAVANSLK